APPRGRKARVPAIHRRCCWPPDNEAPEAFFQWSLTSSHSAAGGPAHRFLRAPAGWRHPARAAAAISPRRAGTRLTERYRHVSGHRTPSRRRPWGAQTLRVSPFAYSRSAVRELAEIMIELVDALCQPPVLAALVLVVLLVLLHVLFAAP